MSDGYYDCYVLTDSRSPELVARFLDHFVPTREELASEYEVPQYAHRPERVFGSAVDLLQYLAENSGEHHAIYWRSVGAGEARHAMVFHTPDGGIIFGLSCLPELDVADRLLSAMKSYLVSDVGGIWFEKPAPRSSVEFRRKVEALKSAESGRPTSG